jgi:hypothetical protein
VREEEQEGHDVSKTFLEIVNICSFHKQLHFKIGGENEDSWEVLDLPLSIAIL